MAYALEKLHFLGQTTSSVSSADCGIERAGTMRIQIFAIRLVLGIIFGVLLARMFFPASGTWLMFAICAALVFFAYCFEYLHKRDRG